MLENAKQILTSEMAMVEKRSIDDISRTIDSILDSA